MIAGPWPKRGINGFNGRAILRDHRKIRRLMKRDSLLVDLFPHVPPPHGWPELKWLAMLLWRQARTRRRPKVLG